MILTQDFILGVLIAAIALFVSTMLTLVYCIAIHMEDDNEDDIDDFTETDSDTDIKNEELPREI
ncbi:hypothetical protein M9Y10_023358 [Tritrichomonas musculus]|uniref:Uncharacterized protein n=1 Tax=Tritrichomonas musculus TaxID=1915356 RepID=A0ABR2KWT4_9EUKA